MYEQDSMYEQGDGSVERGVRREQTLEVTPCVSVNLALRVAESVLEGVLQSVLQ